MKLKDYIRLDKEYRRSCEYSDVKNLLISGVGMFLFCTFILAGALGYMDHPAVFAIYIICNILASSLFLWPMIQVREEMVHVSIFRKFRYMPVVKKLFFRAKVVLMIRFSIIFCIPVQMLHIVGLKKTDTVSLSIVGLWPLEAMLISVCAQYLYLKFLARDFKD